MFLHFQSARQRSHRQYKQIKESKIETSYNYWVRPSVIPRIIQTELLLYCYKLLKAARTEKKVAPNAKSGSKLVEHN